MKVVVITGTPGTGKSTLSRKLAKKLKFKVLNLKPIISKITEGYDKEKKSKIVDEKKFSGLLVKEIKKAKGNLIVASHLSHYLPKKYVNLCIVTKCSELKLLRQRLKKRGYNQIKVKENLEAEIMDVCLSEAIAKKHKILVIDTSRKYSIDKLAKLI
jgi:adenylate kinase